MENNADLEKEFAEGVHTISNLDAMKKTLSDIEKITNPSADNNIEAKPNEEELENTEDNSEIQDNTDNSEEDGEESVEDTGVPQEKVRKLWKERKKQYRLIAEKAEIQRENEKLRTLLNDALENSAYHYTQNAYLDLERAQAQRKAAMEAGDSDAFDKSDTAVHDALFKVNEIRRWENQLSTRQTQQQQNNYSPQYQQPTPANDYQQPYVNEVEQAIVEDWFEQHPYLNQTSVQYDPELTQKVQRFAQQYDEKIMRGEVNDQYYSEKYFDRIDNYINSQRNNKPTTHKGAGSVNYIGGVRNVRGSGTGNRQASSPVELNDLEREWASVLGVSEDNYKKTKLNVLQQRGK